jgi:catechol 2,3-dioxygenase
MKPEPIFDLAHLGHMELLTPKPEESLKFFVDVMGMTVSGQKGESVYLRGWDDYERYSLKLTGSKTSGMEHMALRARSQQALERRVAALKDSEFAIGWVDGDMGQGPSFRCRDPDGHIVELYYETEWYQAPPELKPALKNQAQRFPARGVNVRRLDHLNCLAVDIKANRLFFENYLGLRTTEQIVLNDGTEAAMWMTMSNKSYDFAYTRDHYGKKGRFHHVTYALDSREEILRAADIFLENGARRQPRRSRQRRRPPHPCARLEADRLDRGRAQEGPGLGTEDDRVVSYPRHAASCWLNEAIGCV